MRALVWWLQAFLILPLRAEVLYSIVQVESGPDAPETAGSYAWAINNRGDVVGGFTSPDYTQYHPYLFTASAGMVDLGSPEANGDGYGINDLGAMPCRVSVIG